LPSQLFQNTLFKAFLTLAVGALGAELFNLIGFPAAWLAGSMVAVAVAVLAGMPSAMPVPLRDTLLVILGLTMGSGVTPETVSRVGEWPLTMALLIVAVVAILLATYVYQRRIAGWDRQTAYFAAIPGALSYVMALTLDYPRADAMRIAASQSLRVFILVAVLPMVVTNSGGGLHEVVRHIPPMELPALAALIAVGFASGWATQRLGVPAGWLTGPFFLSALLNASGLVVINLPTWLSIPALIGLGCVIGCRFTSVTPMELLRMLGVCLGAFAVGMTISVAVSAVIWATLGLPFGQLLLAYAPGGLEAMTLLAYLLDLDPAFVAAHQIVRYIGMILILPLVTVRVLGPPQRRS
jgi:membrane AbrB-like protein